jgi:hypothetical protein
MIRAGSSWCDLTRDADGAVEFVHVRGTAIVCEYADTGRVRWSRSAGQALLYLRADASIDGRICAVGQGHDDGQAWAMIEGDAPIALGLTHGVFPVAIRFDSAGGWTVFVQRSAGSYDEILLLSDGAVWSRVTKSMPPTSQGFLYVDAAGTPITQDAGRHTIPGLALPSPAAGGVWVGQSASAATIALYDQGRITPLGTPGGQPPHIVESGGLYYVCSYVDGGSWLSTHRKPFAAVTPPPPDPPKDKPMKPGVTIDSYDSIIRPGQPWEIKFHDRNGVVSCEVEIVNGSVHVTMTNPEGSDRSGARRPVEVRAS